MADNKFVAEAKRRMAQEKARNLRYKRPMLSNMGWEQISAELDKIEEACGDVHYFVNDENDTLLATLDGDEEEEFEFRMTFSDIEGKCDMLRNAIAEVEYGDDEYFEDFFNTCTTALIGNRYEVLGYDTYEEDYYSLCRYDADLATTEAGKRLMRMTKAEMIASIGQCVGILLAFVDLRLQYDSISASMAILRQENTSILHTVKEIEKAYERAAENGNWRSDKEFEALLKAIPDKAWVE